MGSDPGKEHSGSAGDRVTPLFPPPPPPHGRPEFQVTVVSRKDRFCNRDVEISKTKTRTTGLFSFSFSHSHFENEKTGVLTEGYENENENDHKTASFCCSCFRFDISRSLML